MNEKLVQEIVRRIVSLEKWQRDQVGKTPLFDIASEHTPAQITGNQNNYDPGDYDVLRLDSSISIAITGISGGKKGRFLEIINVGSNGITLSHQHASSDPANRILSSTGGNVLITANNRRRLYYDSTTERWRV